MIAWSCTHILFYRLWSKPWRDKVLNRHIPCWLAQFRSADRRYHHLNDTSACGDIWFSPWLMIWFDWLHIYLSIFYYKKFFSFKRAGVSDPLSCPPHLLCLDAAWAVQWQSKLCQPFISYQSIARIDFMYVHNTSTHTPLIVLWKNGCQHETAPACMLSHRCRSFLAQSLNLSLDGGRMKVTRQFNASQTVILVRHQLHSRIFIRLSIWTLCK